MEKRSNFSSFPQWKREAISPLFHNILLPVIRFHVKKWTRFSLRVKRLFEIIEGESRLYIAMKYEETFYSHHTALMSAVAKMKRFQNERSLWAMTASTKWRVLVEYIMSNLQRQKGDYNGKATDKSHNLPRVSKVEATFNGWRFTFRRRGGNSVILCYNCPLLNRERIRFF